MVLFLVVDMRTKAVSVFVFFTMLCMLAKRGWIGKQQDFRKKYSFTVSMKGTLSAIS